MTFGYRSRSGRGGFRSPRGGNSRGSFHNRGRGSDSYFRSSRGSSYNRRGSSYRGNSFKGSSFHERDDYYDSRSSGSKYGHDRYGSHSRKDEDSYHHRDIRESTSGSFSREHARRSDFEPERKKIKSEIGNYKEGVSPRRSYDDLEHSSRNYNSSSSSYHSDTSPFKSYKKDYGDFKKPLPVEHEYSSRRPNRTIRTRGGVRKITKTIRPLMTSSLKRIATGRIARLSTSRLQLLLRKKKQLSIMRLRRAREEQEHMSDEIKHEDEVKPEPKNEDVLSEEEEGEEEDIADEEMDNEPEPVESKPVVESKKVVAKEIKKEPKSEPENAENVESSKSKTKEKLSPIKGLHKNHITLKCIHCRMEYPTFKVYLRHQQSYRHKKAMETVVNRLRQKLSRMRTEQREQQRIIDEQCEDYARTSYCKVCKLNYKQTKQEHYTSDFHINLSEFLNPKCSVCYMTFSTPVMYEHHRCTLAHLKRKAYLAAKKANKKVEHELDDDNNEEDSFMVLDSVGSADESNDENEAADVGKVQDKEVEKMKKKDFPKIVGDEYIKKVTCYYCKLCGMCLRYNLSVSQDELLLSHCRTRFHLKRYSLDKLRRKKEKSSVQKEVKNESSSVNEAETIEQEKDDDKFWTDENGEDIKLSEDEEDSKSSIRYDRFGHSEEKGNIDKQNSETETAEVCKKEGNDE